MGKIAGEGTRTPFIHCRKLVVVLALFWLAVPSRAQNNGYSIVTPAPGSNAFVFVPGTHPPQIYALYGSPSGFIVGFGSPTLPSAVQVNVPVGTGTVYYQFNPGAVLVVEVAFAYLGPSVVLADPYSISWSAPWLVNDGTLLTSPGTQVTCDNSYTGQPCEVGATAQVYIDATGLPVGNYTATITYSGAYFSGSCQIVLNVLPSGVTNPYIPPPPPSRPAGPERRSKGGDPIDLSTGLFIYSKTDLVINDVLPVRMTRTYRQPDFGVSRAFGLGATHPYDMFLWNYGAGFSAMNLILPDGRRINYVRTSSGTDYSSAILKAQGSPGEYFESIVTWNGQGWNLTLKDGTVCAFGQNAPLQSIQDRYGNKIVIARDGSGNITQITSPNGRWIQFTNDTNNRITQLSDNIGRTVRYTYDSNGLLSSVTDAKSGTTNYTYDANGNMLTITDPRGIVYLTNQYDPQGRVILQTLADNSNFQFVYATDGNNKISQTNITDPRGNIRQVAFDTNGYTLTDTLALGKPEQQTTSYNRQSGSNLLLSFTDALNRQTSYGYDPMGNVTSITRLAGTPNPVTTSFTYEPTFNQVASVTDPLNHATSFIYDTHGGLTTVTDSLNHQTTFTYNNAGQPLTVTDGLQNTSRFGFSQGDLVSITNPLGRTTNRFLDGAGRLVSLTDPLGHSVHYAEDNVNQITLVTDTLGGQTSFTRDANGNLVAVTDANNHTSSYTYDGMDRLATRTDALQNTESYQHDGAGNLTQFTDRRGKVAVFNYDGLNRMTFAGYGMNSGPIYESTVGYTYDVGNRLTQAVDSIGGTFTRAYDNLDRLTSDAGLQGSVGYAYDVAGRRTSLTVPGQAVTSYSFDAANRLTQMTQGSNTVSFSYDNANRRTSLTLPNGVTANYGYDNASQLLSLTYTKAPTTLGTLSYGFDLAGRRTTVSGSLAAVNLPMAVSAGYNADNQLTTWGNTPLGYDLNGNLMGDVVHSYIWDARNRLTQIDAGATASFTYDPFGRRTSRTISGTTTSFLYAGANAVQEVAGTNIANSLTGGTDEVFQRTDSAGARDFLTDVLGSTLALTDSTGAVKTSYTFEPFGNTAWSGGPTGNTFAYTGRETDVLGLYYYRARYYNPMYQRFISEDPIGFKGGVNKYAYVLNSPTNFNDPLGLDKNGFWDRTKDVNRCAGQLSQDFSLNPAPGNFLSDALLGNSWGTIAQAGLGPDQANAVAQLIIDNPIPKASLNSLIQAGVAAIPTGGMTSALSIPISYFPGTYNPISVVQTSTTVGETTVGAPAFALLELITAGKLVFDAGVYLGALKVCAQQ
jgi:RHS repeat-associated protein